MRALKFAGAVVGIVLVALGLLMVVGIPAGFLTSTISTRIERDTGYRLTVAGTSRIGLWPKLQRDAARHHAAGRQGPRRQQPRDRRERAGGHDAVERLVGPPRNQRTRHHEAGGPRATAARAPSGSSDRSQACCVGGRCVRGHDQARHCRGWGGDLLEPARPGGKPHRRHQRRDRHRHRSQDHADRNGARKRASGQVRHQGRRPGRAARAADHSGRSRLRDARRARKTADRQGRGAAERAGGDDQLPQRLARGRRL